MYFEYIGKKGFEGNMILKLLACIMLVNKPNITMYNYIA